VVVGVVGHLGHGVDEVDRPGEVAELEGAGDRLALRLPVVQPLEGVVALLVAQLVHVSSGPPARRVRQNR